MAKANVYVELEISPESDAIFVKKMFHVEDLVDEYDYHIQTLKSCHWAEKSELLEGFELQFIKLENVEYDGRKRKITNNDIGFKLSESEYAIAPRMVKGDDPLFGYCFTATEKLKELMENQLNKRKQFIAEEKFVLLKDISVA